MSKISVWYALAPPSSCKLNCLPRIKATVGISGRLLRSLKALAHCSKICGNLIVVISAHTWLIKWKYCATITTNRFICLFQETEFGGRILAPQHLESWMSAISSIVISPCNQLCFSTVCFLLKTCAIKTTVVSVALMLSESCQENQGLQICS